MTPQEHEENKKKEELRKLKRKQKEEKEKAAREKAKLEKERSFVKKLECSFCYITFSFPELIIKIKKKNVWPPYLIKFSLNDNYEDSEIYRAPIKGYSPTNNKIYLWVCQDCEAIAKMVLTMQQGELELESLDINT